MPAKFLGTKLCCGDSHTAGDDKLSTELQKKKKAHNDQAHCWLSPALYSEQNVHIDTKEWRGCVQWERKGFLRTAKVQRSDDANDLQMQLALVCLVVACFPILISAEFTMFVYQMAQIQTILIAGA